MPRGSRAARTFLCLHRPAGGGGAALRRSRRYGHVVLIAGERGIQAHAVRDDRVLSAKDGDAERGTGISHERERRSPARTPVLTCV